MSMHPIEKLARDPHSPYWQDGGAPILTPSVVVFADILGFSDRLRAAVISRTSMELLQKLRSALNEALIHLDPTWMQGPGSFAKRLWDYKAFTDNVVIGYPLRHATEAVLGRVFEKLGMFQLTMVQAGFFVRGAVAVGDLYMDRDIVFGEGLLEAVSAEQSIARDPRVVLAPSAVTHVQEHLGYYSDPSDSPQNRDLIRDADGQVFLNYLDAILIVEEDHGPFIEPLLDHKREVERCLREFLGQPPIWSKYYWSATYHNYFCSRREWFTDEHRIDLSDFQPGMRSLVE
jgi:hypothetical protein